jgi:hypothetical protein
MSLARFETALPDTMTIEGAVRAMIEGDDRIKLPMCYETVGFPFFDRLVECCSIMERRYDSSLEYESRQGQEAAREQLEDMLRIQKNAELYREDLDIIADKAVSDAPPNLESAEDEEIDPDHRLVDRSFLVPWAYKVHGVDIHGHHARQKRAADNSAQDPPEGLSIPARTKRSEQDRQAWAEKNMLSGQRLWRVIVGDQAEPTVEYSEGQKLFLSLAWLMNELLTKRNGEWRRRLNDETDKTRDGFISDGKLKMSVLVRAITREFPRHKQAKDPYRATKGYIKIVMDFLTKGYDHVVDFSSGQSPMAYRTLFGLARAVWNAKTGKLCPDLAECEYPPDVQSVLAEGLSNTAPITPNDLSQHIEAARLEVIRQKQVADNKA